MSCFKTFLCPVLGRIEENYENMTQVAGLVGISTSNLSDMIQIIYHSVCWRCTLISNGCRHLVTVSHRGQ
jgi:hypothetical protein